MIMEASMIVDFLLGAVLTLFMWIIKRVFVNIDRLNTRVNELATSTVSRGELDTHIDRILDRIDALEQRLLNRE